MINKLLIALAVVMVAFTAQTYASSFDSAQANSSNGFYYETGETDLNFFWNTGEVKGLSEVAIDEPAYQDMVID